MIVCRARLPRAGLGNRLFPWARCRIFSLVTGLPMLAPSWTQLTLGPLLRGQRDRRFYHDLFRPTEAEVGGWRRRWLEWTSAEIPEPEDFTSAQDWRPPPGPPARRPNRVVVFDGEKDHFRRLNGWEDVLRAHLRAMTRPRWVCRGDRLARGPIGIHVRRGDFQVAASAAEFRTRGGLRTPLSWFVESLAAIRDLAGAPAGAFVVSDGTSDELAELLALPGVTRVATGSAAGDLLALSRSRFLIASGGSTFSAWATFLGQIPTIAYPGQSLTWFALDSRKDRYVGEFDPRAAPPPVLLDQIGRVLRPGPV
jgi:hypothetical protein